MLGRTGCSSAVLAEVGVLEAGALPAKLDGKASIAWEAALPGEGLSSPVVVGEKVFLTCSSGAEQDRLHVFCLGSKNGKTLWERQFWATGGERCTTRKRVWRRRRRVRTVSRYTRFTRRTTWPVWTWMGT